MAVLPYISNSMAKIIDSSLQVVPVVSHHGGAAPNSPSASDGNQLQVATSKKSEPTVSLPKSLATRLRTELATLKQQGRYRQLSLEQFGTDFCSNDYLGIALSHDGYHGSGGSRLLSGNHSDLELLEQQCVELFSPYSSKDTALVTSSGYSANLLLLSAIASRHDAFFYDELVHASLRDGIRLSPAKSKRFPHNDLRQLEALLASNSRGTPFVVVDALYSMDGDCAPLAALAELVTRYEGCLIVDEAHSSGVYGSGGAGLVAGLIDEGHLSPEAAILKIHTFGKAVGVHGACCIVPGLVRDYLVNVARPLIYSTAIAPSTCRLFSEHLAIMESANDARRSLWQLSDYFDNCAERLGLPLVASGSPIKALLVPGNENCMAAAEFCQKRGFDVRAVRSPTVATGAERVRVTLHSFNRKAEVDELMAIMYSFLHEKRGELWSV